MFQNYFIKLDFFTFKVFIHSLIESQWVSISNNTNEEKIES